MQLELERDSMRLQSLINFLHVLRQIQIAIAY